MTKEKGLLFVKKATEYVIRNNVNSACFWVLYQPELSLEMMKRFQKRK